MKVDQKPMETIPNKNLVMGVMGFARFFPETQKKALIEAKTWRNPSHPSPTHPLWMMINWLLKLVQSQKISIHNPSPTHHQMQNNRENGRNLSYDADAVVDRIDPPGGKAYGTSG